MDQKLILLRHGASIWNDLNLFTGWVDIPLSERGIKESFAAGEALAEIPIDLIFTSTLHRSQQTVSLCFTRYKKGRKPVFTHSHEGKLGNWGKIYSPETESHCLPVICAWELNERMYGELQGMNKDEMRKRFGEEQVKLWRRSFDTAPPQGESLKMTCERAIPYFKNKILPHLEKGKTVLICAHGNSLRAIRMHIENLSAEEVINLEIATGEIKTYSYVQGMLNANP